MIESEVVYPLIYSPNPQITTMARPIPRAGNSIQVSPMGDSGPSTLAILEHFPRCINREVALVPVFLI